MLSLSFTDPQRIQSVLDNIAYSPVVFFNLLGVVSPEDCLSLIEYQDHFRLWEKIANKKDFEASDIALAAKESLGQENLKTFSLSLVHVNTDSDLTIYEIEKRALSGIKLASSLSMGDLERVVVEYADTLGELQVKGIGWHHDHAWFHFFGETKNVPEDLQEFLKLDSCYMGIEDGEFGGHDFIETTDTTATCIYCGEIASNQKYVLIAEDDEPPKRN